MILWCRYRITFLIIIDKNKTSMTNDLIDEFYNIQNISNNIDFKINLRR